ncbi:hypothetical protein PHYPO_G00056160 [Pangasianodon hypophthalmus]|uniref:Uncharacterized protein n=1 Tax=Pangasianodon hypophthalmus TaxID=310915 RepID=A0A5N5M857_PANHP|nr:hypothetical protein PHYPO_G00056160 [Pangasianodon hypophthalmus]
MRSAAPLSALNSAARRCCALPCASARHGGGKRTRCGTQSHFCMSERRKRGGGGPTCGAVTRKNTEHRECGGTLLPNTHTHTHTQISYTLHRHKKVPRGFLCV